MYLHFCHLGYLHILDSVLDIKSVDRDSDSINIAKDHVSSTSLSCTHLNSSIFDSTHHFTEQKQSFYLLFQPLIMAPLLASDQASTPGTIEVINETVPAVVARAR